MNYIVYNSKTGTPLQKCQDKKSYGDFTPLLHGDFVTSFPTKSKAKEAIINTLKWVTQEWDGRTMPDWASEYHFKIMELRDDPQNQTDK